MYVMKLYLSMYSYLLSPCSKKSNDVQGESGEVVLREEAVQILIMLSTYNVPTLGT